MSRKRTREQAMRNLFLAVAVVALLVGDAGKLPISAAEAQVPLTADHAISPAAALDRLDNRAPLPLLPMMAQHQKENMRDHLVEVQQVVAGLAANDYAAIAEAAARIGSSEQMGHMCTHMGAAAPGFTEQALAFHRIADGIVEAAKAEDGQGVLRTLGATLQACTACHATWKQQVVDEDAWRSMTSQAAPTGRH